MTFLTDRQKRVLEQLRHHTNAYVIAEELEEAPFTVRAEISALKRLKLVRLHFTHRSLEWRLTERGERLSYGLDQRELFR